MNPYVSFKVASYCSHDKIYKLPQQQINIIMTYRGIVAEYKQFWGTLILIFRFQRSLMPSLSKLRALKNLVPSFVKVRFSKWRHISIGKEN